MKNITLNISFGNRKKEQYNEIYIKVLIKRQKSLFNNDSRNQKITIHSRIIKKRAYNFFRINEAQIYHKMINYCSFKETASDYRLTWNKTNQYYEGPMSIKNIIKKKVNEKPLTHTFDQKRSLISKTKRILIWCSEPQYPQYIELLILFFIQFSSFISFVNIPFIYG